MPYRGDLLVPADIARISYVIRPMIPIPQSRVNMRGDSTDMPDRRFRSFAAGASMLY